MAFEFKFPDIGEGIAEGELLAWKVKEGDLVAQDQTVAEMETDKAVVELPSPRAGRVARLHAAEGDIVKVGAVLVTIEEDAAVPAAPPAAAEPVAAAAAEPAALPKEPPAAPEPEVTDEPYTGSVVGRLEEAPEEPEAVAPPTAPVIAAPSPSRARTGRGRRSRHAFRQGAGQGAGRRPDRHPRHRAGGPHSQGRRARRGRRGGLRDSGSERGGRGSWRLQPQAGAVPVATAAAAPAGTPLMSGTLSDDLFGPVERVPFRGVRRTMARHMAESVAKQAQVTTMDEADVTIIKRIKEKERTVAAERGVRLTYLAFAIKACTAALKRFPRLNATLEESGDEFVLKRYYNIGIAIDTKSGLVVPNIKDAEKKSIFEIAAEIVDLVDRAEQRKIEVRELHGGTFTITNYGAIGGTFATPVINYPEVAILGMGRVRELPVVRAEKVVTRLMLPLSLTFDHQLIDGAEAARFLNLVIGYLEDPDLLLLEGA